MKLIVGLGNPGKKYQHARHNAGFLVLDRLREALIPYQPSAWELSKKFNAEISGCTVKGEKVILAKPMTFMNDSGIAVQLIAHFYQIPPRDIMVVHDDKDILLGERKIQTNRGPAGHNGVISIIQRLGTEDFTRIRMGIKGADEKKMRDVSAFVLGRFGFFEKKPLRESITQTVHEIEAILGIC